MQKPTTQNPKLVTRNSPPNKVQRPNFRLCETLFNTKHIKKNSVHLCVKTYTSKLETRHPTKCNAPSFDLRETLSTQSISKKNSVHLCVKTYNPKLATQNSKPERKITKCPKSTQMSYFVLSNDVKPIKKQINFTKKLINYG